MKTDLIFYVGSPENDPFGTYVYLDLRIERFDQVTLAETEKLDDVHGEILCDEIRKLVNKATIFAKSLRLPVYVNMEEILKNPRYKIFRIRIKKETKCDSRFG